MSHSQHTIRSVVPFARPQKFSDPYFDWGDNEQPAVVIKKADSALTPYDLRCIFYGPLPMGTYEESGYYLPQLIELLKKEDDVNVLGDFLRWLFLEERHLKAYPKLMECIRLDLLDCLHSRLTECSLRDCGGELQDPASLEFCVDFLEGLFTEHDLGWGSRLCLDAIGIDRGALLAPLLQDDAVSSQWLILILHELNQPWHRTDVPLLGIDKSHIDHALGRLSDYLLLADKPRLYEYWQPIMDAVCYL